MKFLILCVCFLNFSDKSIAPIFGGKTHGSDDDNACDVMFKNLANKSEWLEILNSFYDKKKIIIIS
jgi:hypothetical protein